MSTIELFSDDVIKLQNSPWDSLLKRIANETMEKTPAFPEIMTPRKSKIIRDYGYTPGRQDTMEFKINNLGLQLLIMSLIYYLIKKVMNLMTWTL